MIEENSQPEKKAISIVDANFKSTREVDLYCKKAKDTEERVQRTTIYYQGRVIHCKKRAHHNWWAARFAERELHDLKKEYVCKRKRCLMVEENCQPDQRVDVSLVDEDWEYKATEILIYRY
ncbi:cTAGE family member 6-like [Ochotona princeps]|uniref:cTAGE family member 6-like n=1 Tax=Ochotona princeps TaxID=9978 RepID=UPI002714B06E|nr:cTAGE family member 6-like [Ochotona princeps]XP_058523314.1 cTAGE family member 6-like [Ochotona princeps]